MKPLKIITSVNWMVYAFTFIPAVLLLIAATSHQSQFFYEMLRCWVSTSAILGACCVGRSLKFVPIAAFVFLAVLFNPLFPVHLKRDTWVLLDIFASVVFAISFFGLFWTVATYKPSQSK